jgi:hypothetical protein
MDYQPNWILCTLILKSGRRLSLGDFGTSHSNLLDVSMRLIRKLFLNTGTTPIQRYIILNVCGAIAMIDTKTIGDSKYLEGKIKEVL